jgi:uncharacterized protein YhhL (DUF1145 family)
MTAGDLVAFLLSAGSRRGMSHTPLGLPKLTLMAALYLMIGLLLGIIVWQIIRPSSLQRSIVTRWSLIALLSWAGGIAYLLGVYYPLPYQIHHADKLLSFLGLLLAWTISLALVPKGLKQILESRWFHRLRVVLFNVFVFLVISELTLRLTDPLLARGGLFSAASTTPAGLAPYRAAHGSIRHTNSQGFHDRERTVERISSGPRVLAVGDSFVMGAGVTYDESFTTLLEKALQARYPGAEVINFGVPGYQPDNYLSLLKSHGVQYRPDLVLLGFYLGNDLAPPSQSEMIVAGQRYKVHINGNWGHDHLDWDHWYLFHNLNYIYRVGTARIQHLMGRPEHGFLDIAPGRPQSGERKTSFPGWSRSYLRLIQSIGDQYLREDTAIFKDCWIHTQAILEEINELLRARGISWILVLLPAEEQVDSELQRLYLKTIKVPPERSDFEKPQRLLHAWGKANSVPIFDLTTPIRSEVAHTRLYFTNDTHWNDTGHALAAASILPGLQQYLDVPMP